MKKCISTLTTILILFAPIYAWAATYYVGQRSAGAGNGRYYANRMSVSTHNSSNFEPGDIIFLCDTITSQVRPPSSGSSGNEITYRGDYAGHAGIIDRNGGADGIWITAKDYLIFQSIEITDFTGDGGIVIYQGCDYITIKKCTIHDGWHRAIFPTRSGGSRPSYITIGGAPGDGNVIYNIAMDHSAGADIAFNNACDIVISYNQLYGNATHGVDGITTEWTERLLIEYNRINSHNQTGQAENAIDLKSRTKDVIIRFNEIYDHTNPEQGAVHVQMDSDNVAIYGNRIYNNNCGILIFDGAYEWAANGTHMQNIKIWSNLIYDSDMYGIQISANSGDSINNVVIYNNVFAENGGNPSSSSHTAIRITTGSGHVVKNNIFYKNRPNETDYVHARYEVSGVTLEHNQYYSPGHTSYVYWSGGNRTIATLKGSYNKETHGSDGDPGFTNAGINDYTLLRTSTCKDNGAYLSGLAASYTIQGETYNMYWQDGLDDSSCDWNTPYPKVMTANQTLYGSWEKGAYVFTGNEPPSIITPTGLKLKVSQE